jgi:hypothetical protein
VNQTQLAWCKSNGLDAAQIQDCDPVSGRVTFTDGSVRQKTEVYTRCMGYHRPTSAFNVGKRQEHADRKMFREDRTPLSFRDEWPHSGPPGIDFGRFRSAA